MILKALRNFSTIKTPKLIPISVRIDDEVMKFSYPLHTKLAKNLEKSGVPLDFECGFACECSTCAVEFSPQDYKKVSEDQPPSPKELETLKVYSHSNLTRLSCQLFVMPYFENMEIKPVIL